MALVDMALTRKSDGLILADEFSQWSDWYEQYSANNIPTLTGVPYQQFPSVVLYLQDLTALWADHFTNSTQARWRAMISAHRYKRDLTFADSYGDSYDVRIYEIKKPERLQDIRTKNIRRAEITVYRVEYLV